MVLVVVVVWLLRKALVLVLCHCCCIITVSVGRVSPTESGQCRWAGTVSWHRPGDIRHWSSRVPSLLTGHLTSPPPTSPAPTQGTTEHHRVPHHHTASLSVVCLLCSVLSPPNVSAPGHSSQPAATRSCPYHCLSLLFSSLQCTFIWGEKYNLFIFSRGCCRTSLLCRCPLSLSLSVSLCVWLPECVVRERERERDGDQHGLYAVNEKYCQAAGPETTRGGENNFWEKFYWWASQLWLLFRILF